MSKTRLKPPKTKRYKGYLRIPLDTSCSFEELAAQAIWTGDWAIPDKHKEITNPHNKYIWHINVYMYNIIGEKTLEKVTSPSKMNAKAMEVLLQYALREIAEKHPMMDYEKSYLTVSV